MFPFDPFAALAGEAARVITDGWIALCLGFWSAGLWLLRLALGFLDSLLTPDVSADGPGAELYRYTFWIAGVLVLVLAIVQTGVAALRRDARDLGRLLLGLGQFIFVWGGMLGYAALLVQAAGGLTRSLMEALLKVTTFRELEPWTPFEAKDVTDGALATVLLFAGLFLVFAAIGQFLVMLMRSAAMLVLVATAPIATAGLVSELGKSWFWKSVRWFHAAVFAPVLMVLVLGVGLKFAEGVATGGATTLEGSVGTAIASTLLIAVSVFSPIALFKMLAFVDPGTSSGANMRAGWAAVGGLQGLLRGRDSGTSAASTSEPDGRSTGERSADNTMSTRLSTAMNAAGGALGQATRGGNPWVGAAAAIAGPAISQGASKARKTIGGAAADTLGAVAGFGAAATAIGADMSNQTGVGHQVYHPDFSGMSHRNGRPPHPATRDDNDHQARDATATTTANGTAPASAGTASSWTIPPQTAWRPEPTSGEIRDQGERA